MDKAVARKYGSNGRRDKFSDIAIELAQHWVDTVTEEQLQLAMEGVRTTPVKCEYIRFAEHAHDLGKYNPKDGTGMAELKSLYGIIDGAVSDSRSQVAVKHTYANLALAAVLGMMQGHMQLDSIADFCKNNFPWLRDHLGFIEPPSIHALRCMFSDVSLGMDRVYQAAISFIGMQLSQGYERLGWTSKDLRHIAVDSKKSSDVEYGEIMTMGLWYAREGCFGAQICVNKKISEIAGIIELFKWPCLSGRLKDSIVSADAFSCTRRLSMAVHDVGAIPVFNAKGNAGAVYYKVSDFFDSVTETMSEAIRSHFRGTSSPCLSAWAYAAQEMNNLRFPNPTSPFELIEFNYQGKKLSARRTVELSHGGVWTRTYVMSTDLARFPEFSQVGMRGERWIGLQSVVLCHSAFFSDEFGACPKTENRIYFTGSDDISIAEKVIQNHRGIENAYFRNDSLFRDDFSKLTFEGGSANLLMIKRIAEYLIISAYPLQDNQRRSVHDFITELGECTLDELVAKVFSMLYPMNFDPDGKAKEKTPSIKTKSLKKNLSPKTLGNSKAKN
ncbi:MAG: hypothetical protein LBT59_31215 [Clostridiales bacterium]|jgi:hypothetical protein|nr:hypothetical protein [Clostridiales bacterium]